MTDKNSCILIIKIIIDDEIYILANTYNPNIEMEQLPTLSQYSRFLENSMISITQKLFLVENSIIIVTHRGKPTLGKQLLLKYSTTLIYVMPIESETEI